MNTQARGRGWAMKARNGGIDANQTMGDELREPPFIERYQEEILVVPLEAVVEFIRRGDLAPGTGWAGWLDYVDDVADAVEREFGGGES